MNPHHAARFDLSGRLALVTGSSRGLGLAMARGLAEAGAEVVLNARDPAAVDRAIATLRAEGLRARPLPFDVTDAAAVSAAVATLPAPDILVHNAGTNIRKAVEDYTDAEWSSVLDTHLTAAMRLCRAAVPGMKARGSGKVIVTGSLASELGRPTITAYAAAKGGLKMFVRALAVELAPHGIQANAIGPGWFDTELNAPLAANPEWVANVKRRTPAGRYADPSEITGAAVFLASPGSDFVTGQILYVDGGVTANMM